MGSLLILFQISEILSFRFQLAEEFRMGIAIVLFAGLGYWIARHGRKNAASLLSYQKLGLTDREYEILLLIKKGHSNKEIGEKLFIAETTVKTHVTKLFKKLEVTRRTQAINRARALKIIG